MTPTRRPKTSASATRLSATLTPNRVWLMIFGLWAVFLTGIFGNIGGSPGAIQALRLNGLLSAKQEQVREMENEMENLALEANQLEKNSVVQHREIRKVLGYAASNEIIFDFSTSNDTDL